LREAVLYALDVGYIISEDAYRLLRRLEKPLKVVRELIDRCRIEGKIIRAKHLKPRKLVDFL